MVTVVLRLDSVPKSWLKTFELAFCLDAYVRLTKVEVSKDYILCLLQCVYMYRQMAGAS